MQEGSPGRQDKRMRNERYNTPTKQKQLSVKSAKHKAKEFAAKDDKSTRVLAKQAILKELNTQLIVKAEGIAPQNRKTRGKTGNDTEYPKSSKKKGEEQKPIINLASKIPRRIHGATAMALNQKRNEPILLQDCKASYSEAAMGVKNGEIFTENRERYQCLAEKYVLIWKKKTFGRVTPDLARKHHERKLKKHTLELWQDIWWTGRKGWKLNVRADYHNRYRLWQKAWRSWREYVKYCQVKKAKEKLAHQNAHHTVLMKCWAAWRKYISTRRGKRRLTDHAMNFAQIQLKRRVWRQWLAQLELRRNLHYMDRKALEFWANNLIGKDLLLYLPTQIRSIFGGERVTTLPAEPFFCLLDCGVLEEDCMNGVRILGNNPQAEYQTSGEAVDDVLRQFATLAVNIVQQRSEKFERLLKQMLRSLA